MLVASTSRMMRRELDKAEAQWRCDPRRSDWLTQHLSDARKNAALLDALCLIILQDS